MASLTFARGGARAALPVALPKRLPETVLASFSRRIHFRFEGGSSVGDEHHLQAAGANGLDDARGERIQGEQDGSVVRAGLRPQASGSCLYISSIAAWAGSVSMRLLATSHVSHSQSKSSGTSSVGRTARAWRVGEVPQRGMREEKWRCS